MSAAAYEVNGQSVDAAHFYAIACDPQRSVVVEACAGAGKTWMLVSRILRALLDGVPAHQILAITFTKKAAGEMRARLNEWLKAFAQASEAQRHTELLARGVGVDRLAELSLRLAALHQEWLDEGRGAHIHTIHGWFSRLVQAAPMDVLHELQLPPQLQLIEDSDAVWPELWARLLKKLDALGQGQPSEMGEQEGPAQGSALDDFAALVEGLGAFNVEAWLRTALSNRLEITLADRVQRLDDSVLPVGEWSQAWVGFDSPYQALAAESARQNLWALAKELGSAKGKTAQSAASDIEAALGLIDLPAQAQALMGALLTKDGSPKKKMGDSAQLAWAQDWLVSLRQAQAQDQAHRLHQGMVKLSRCLFEEYAQLKAETGQADMVDLELAAARLLGDPHLSGWIQERLDSQVRHVLMDEFQDTSPLQWQTLKSWLSGYAGAGGGMSGQSGIQVFLVGDPKQSIYRFRRADPRVFEAAKRFVIEALGGDLLACDHTRRNAPGVIEGLNRVMSQAHEEGAFPGFRQHTTASEASACIRVLPSAPRDATAPDEPPSGWRDSLLTPRHRPSVHRKDAEANQVARAIAHMLAHEAIAPQDIQVLARTRATLALVAQALDEQGVPHLAPEDTLLIDTPTVRDMVALLDTLVSPQHDLSLAQVLKSPVMGASDADLMGLAARAKCGSWWTALMQWAHAHPGPDAPSEALLRAAQLLSRWRECSTVLPPHDLLERIVTDGDVRARLMATVLPSQHAAALSHVDALLSQSLSMDAGRDATPYRFVRAIKRLPVHVPPRAREQAVQLLTIHGAKGLEAKVVFMVDTDAPASRSDSLTLLVDWPDSEPAPLRCAFVQSESRPPPSLTEAVAEHRQAQEREELNALYVALTRAREQWVFSRTEPRHAHDGSWWNRLVRSGVIDPEAVPMASPDASPEPITPNADAQPCIAPLRVLPALQARQTVLAHRPPTLAVSTEQALLQTLGQVVHRALEWLTVLPVSQRSAARQAEAVRAAAKEQELPEAMVDEALACVKTILGSAALQSWLDPSQLAWAGNEVALTHRGQSLRMDRLVAVNTPQGRHWWVLDYKLSHRPQAMSAYREQMVRYVEAVSALQAGERVSAALISGLGEWIPIVEASSTVA